MSDIAVIAITEEPEKLESDKCKCGKESDYGCHGARDRNAYSEYFCKECYNKE